MSSLYTWLDKFPQKDGYYIISQPKRYKFDEKNWDKMQDLKSNTKFGIGAANLLRELGSNLSGPALEIGCGTGFTSIGLVASNLFSELLISDPSPVFIEITKNKMKEEKYDEFKIYYAVLLGEDIDIFPSESLSSIILRATLHHIIDIKKFLNEAARILSRNGVLLCSEPCYEGHVIMGILARFIPMVFQQAGAELDIELKDRISHFIKTMEFYARTDIDKSKYEDKHAFRIDVLMKYAKSAGLDLTFFPNVNFPYFAQSVESRPRGTQFTQFFRNYLSGFVGHNEKFLIQFDHYFVPWCDFLDQLDPITCSPYLHGIFAFSK